MVANPSPKIIAKDIDRHMPPPPNASGTSPIIVVNVVIRIGRSLELAALMIANSKFTPFAISMRVESMSKIALFTMMPIRAIKPRRVMNPKEEFVIKSPGTTPIIIGGIVHIMIA